MKLKDGLKRKNKLVSEINDLYNKINGYNTINVGNSRPYSIRDLLTQVDSKTTELIELKTKITNANIPILSLIFELSEVKNKISRLKSMTCVTGIDTSYGYSDSKIERTSEIEYLEKDEMIKSLETRIEEIQSQLDYHNFTTDI